MGKAKPWCARSRKFLRAHADVAVEPGIQLQRQPRGRSSFTLNATQIRQTQTVHPEFVYPFVPDTGDAQNASFFTAAGITGLKPDVSFFAPDFQNPRSLNITGGIEQALGNNWALSLDWVHVNTVRLERIRDVNLYPPTVAADNSTPAQERPIYNTSVRPNPLQRHAQPAIERTLELRRLHRCAQ